MKSEIEIRVLQEANYVIETKETVRNVAKFSGVSKSTVHYDLTVRLQKIDSEKWKMVAKILQKNLSLRHIRGGLATKKKYEKIAKNTRKNTQKRG